MKSSLLRRNIGLLVGVVLAGQLLAGMMVVALVLRPQTMRVADMSARMLNAVSIIMDDRRPDEQARIVHRINSRAGIRIRARDNPPDAGGRAFPNFIERIFMRRLAEQLAGQDVMNWRTDTAGHLWMEVELGGKFWWVSVTPPRMAGPLVSLIIAGLIAFFVAVAGGLLLQRRLNLPLRALAGQVQSYRPGSAPSAIAIDGPREIAAVAHAFNDMGNRIAAHEQERALMLAGVSHDLRTPLARLRLAVEMMPGEDAALRESAHRQIEQIDRMLGQFLAFARDGHDEEPEATDIAGLVNAASEDSGLSGQIGIEVDAGLTARVRPLAMRRTIQNLLENASRYGSAPIAVCARRDSEGSIIIEVIDQGEGFHPAMAEHFTKPFAKADTARGGNSTGLGLAIAHKHVSQEGGKLVFERTPCGFVARIAIKGLTAVSLQIPT